ncbi:MAG: D-alanyl-D-alanine carboxypeptidase [Actinobacteria bacterium]|nr:D-alanyl-D-alanine carboxypeptidase [Actinomycetota bacterium]
MARRRNPYPALVVMALIPAAGLFGLWRWASGQQPDPIVAPTSPTSVPVVQPAALTTPLLSVRRAPAVLSRVVNEAQFLEALQPFVETLGPASCFAVAVDGDEVITANAAASLRPASNVKLITAAVALEVLGPEFTYTTTVKGVVGADGVVAGDLYFVGGGDPVLNSIWWDGPNKHYPPFNRTAVESLADAILAAGVTSITGAVVGDASRYDSELYPPSWAAADQLVEGGPVSALLVNDSRITATAASKDDPVVAAATVLTTLLEERGITVGDAAAAGQVPAASSTIASIVSQPLPAILAEMLTTSDNTTAEMVLKEIGLARGNAGTREAGLAVVMSTLRTWDVPVDGLTLVDGSGLSDDDRATCGALLAVIEHGSLADGVGQGLAIGGATGGTLFDEFVAGQPLSGVIRAKTGTLYNYADGTGTDGKPGAKSLSGYVPRDDGSVIEFSLLLNGQQIAEEAQYRPFWTAMAAIFAEYPSGPTVQDLGPR